MVPERIIRGIGDAGVKADLGEIPVLFQTDRGGKGGDVIVRVRMTERAPGGVKEILAVHEGDGAFDYRFSGHRSGPKNNPARGRYRRVERGVDKF